LEEETKLDQVGLPDSEIKKIDLEVIEITLKQLAAEINQEINNPDNHHHPDEKIAQLKRKVKQLEVDINSTFHLDYIKRDTNALNNLKTYQYVALWIETQMNQTLPQKEVNYLSAWDSLLN